MQGGEILAEHEERAAGLDDRPDSDLRRRITRWRRQAKSHLRRWRAEAQTCYDVVAGGGAQWDSHVREILRSQGRVAIEYNKVGPMVDAIVGAEIGNRHEIQYYPREEGDIRANAVIGAAAKWARQECDAEDEESDAFRDTLICGLGYIGDRMDREVEPGGSIRIERKDPLTIWYDPNAKRRNLEDARYLFEEREISRDEAKELYPSVPLHYFETADDEDDDSAIGHHSRAPDFYAGEGDDHSDKDTVELVDFQYWEREKVWDAVDPMTGDMIELDRAKWPKFKQIWAAFGLEVHGVRRLKRVYYRVPLAGDRPIGRPQQTGLVSFTILPITGKRDRNKAIFYGVVRPMIDPQRWLNKLLSQIQHILDANAKGGNMVRKGAVDDFRKFERDWSASDKNVEVKDPTGIVPKTAPPLPPGIGPLLEAANDAFFSTTGINREWLGMADRDQPGVLEAQRKQAVYGVLGDFFNALRAYRKRQGRLLLHFLAMLPPGTLIRIQEEGNQQVAQLVFGQDDVGRFDVIVDESPTSPNQMNQDVAVLMQAMPYLEKAGLSPQTWAKIVHRLPVSQAMKQAISQDLTQPKPGQQAAQQLQQAGAQAELAKTQSEAQENSANAARNAAEAERTRMETLMRQYGMVA